MVLAGRELAGGSRFPCFGKPKGGDFFITFNVPEAESCGEDDLCAGWRDAEGVGDLKVE